MAVATQNTGSFATGDGQTIFFRHAAAQPERGRMVLAHGMGEHSGRYAHVISRITGTGVSVWAPDHRGHGRSTGKRGHIDSFDQYISDLDQMVAIARKDMPPGLPFFMLGHSLGGLMALSWAETRAEKTDRIIASSPGLRPAVKVPLIKGALGRIMSRIYPSLTFDNELDSTALSHDPDVISGYDHDPLVHRRISARMFTEMISEMEHTTRRAAMITNPLLMQVAGADRLVDPALSVSFFEDVASTDKRLHLYDPLFHEIYNESAADRAEVLNDLQNWISGHM